MDLLNRTERRGARSRRLAAIAAMALLGGCVLFDGGGERALVFSHALHVGEEGLSCVSCHEDYGVDPEPGMPALDSCTVCHELWEEEVPLERRVENLFTPDGEYRALAAAALSGEIVFDHLVHVQAELECNACHADIEANRRIDASQSVTMQVCMDCHAERARPNACATCHREIDTRWAPPNHRAAWEREHGRSARLEAGAGAQSCALCHSEESCAACHEALPPRDHTAQFRLRGHGVLASIERERCAACHEASTCEQCHSEVLPLSHRGRFGSPRNNHCLGCHLPLSSIECRACHADTPSHDLAPPKPGWHNPAMNCRQCHGASLPLSHADNGTNCNLCHP